VEQFRKGILDRGFYFWGSVLDARAKRRYERETEVKGMYNQQSESA